MFKEGTKKYFCKSITDDSDEEIEEEKPKDKYLSGQCFLKIKN
jgi:hypothetical protein